MTRNEILKLNKTGNARINLAGRWFRVTIIVLEKQYVSHVVSFCVDLVIRHAMHMRRVIICDLPGCTIFNTISHKRHDLFLKKLY